MSVGPIRIGQQLAARADQSRKLEWLETNGLGGYASGTVSGIHTRRYHGLLVAATTPPVGRMVLLAKMEETLIVGDRRFDFSANEYPGAIHPRGMEYLREFRLDPFPIFVYQMDGVEMEKRILMVHGENTTVIEYELLALNGDPLPPCQLELRPLLAGRDFHSVTHANEAIEKTPRTFPGGLKLQPYPDVPPLYLGHNAAKVEATGEWYYRFEYAIERERGLEYQEDLFQPVRLTFDFSTHRTATVVASTAPRKADMAAAAAAAERDRRARLTADIPVDTTLVRHLWAAADQYLVKRSEGSTVIAGYHWFSDWGRDTMIALPGLTLTTGRYDVAREILATFAASVDRGMLPNRFPDHGEAPEYNTVDATLWFFEAVRDYLEHTGDSTFVKECLYPRLKEILDWHLRGTRYRIKMDTDALLHCGEPGVQLTWMDAKVGDWVVTPRTGKPVEIQALWFNALRIVEDLAERFGDSNLVTLMRDLARTAQRSFRARFWNNALGCLFDVVDGDQSDGNRVDGSIRPNQIFAVSLRHTMLDVEQARQVVEVVRRELWTPAGLRTLSAHDPRYRGRYEGGVLERDGSYHQGTVWPWLLGPFITAYLRVNGNTAEARQQAERWLAPVAERLCQTGLGQVPEIADGDYPHQPRGCMAQAWSVAELLRCAVLVANAGPAQPVAGASAERAISAA